MSQEGRIEAKRSYVCRLLEMQRPAVLNKFGTMSLGGSGEAQSSCDEVFGAE